MKFAILFLAACVALVNSEDCKAASECDYEHCSNDWEVACAHGTISTLLGRPGEGTCTCVRSGSLGAGCKAKSDCDHTTCPSLGGRFGIHCADNNCVCTINRLGGN